MIRKKKFEECDNYTKNISSTIVVLLATRSYFYNNASNGISFFQNAAASNIPFLYENSIIWENYSERVLTYRDMYVKTTQMKNDYKTAYASCPTCFYNEDIKNLEKKLQVIEKQILAMLTTVYYAKVETGINKP